MLTNELVAFPLEPPVRVRLQEDDAVRKLQQKEQRIRRLIFEVQMEDTVFLKQLIF